LFLVPYSLFLVPCSLPRTTSFLEQILSVVSLTRYLVCATLTTLWCNCFEVSLCIKRERERKKESERARATDTHSRTHLADGRGASSTTQDGARAQRLFILLSLTYIYTQTYIHRHIYKHRHTPRRKMVPGLNASSSSAPPHSDIRTTHTKYNRRI
jgi:hypothetical protein